MSDNIDITNRMKPVRKCVTLPRLHEWYEVTDRLPNSGEVVMAICEVNSSISTCQVVFYGSDFLNEFRLGETAVHVTHWLHIAATHKSDVIQD